MLEKRKAAIIVLVLFLASFLFSLAIIEHRPLHHDEGVNGYFVSKIVEGEGWEYDSENYHGPTFFYITALSFFAFGNNIFALRFFPILIGSLSVLIPWMFRKELGLAGLAVASFVLAFSPAMLYYSGFAIHEILFCVFLFAAISFFLKFVDEKKKSLLFAGSASLALLMATKEAGIIIGPAVLLFAFAYAKVSGRKCSNFMKKKKDIFFAILIFLLVYSALFTSFYSNWNGLGDSVKTLTQWGPRVVEEPGHQKPFGYYFETLLFSETLLVLVAVFGLGWAVGRKEKIFAGIGLFYLVFFLVISLVPYKTPWIVVNLIPGMALCAGYLWKRIRQIGFKIGTYNFHWWVFALLLVLPVQAFNLNYANSSGEENKLAYVHTTEELWEWAEEAKQADREILIAIGEHSTWPLPWYFRDKKVNYYGLDAAENIELLEEFDFILLREEEGKIIEKKLEKFENRTMDFRPGTRLTAFTRREFTK